MPAKGDNSCLIFGIYETQRQVIFSSVAAFVLRNQFAFNCLWFYDFCSEVFWKNLLAAFCMRTNLCLIVTRYEHALLLLSLDILLYIRPQYPVSGQLCSIYSIHFRVKDNFRARKSDPKTSQCFLLSFDVEVQTMPRHYRSISFQLTYNSIFFSPSYCTSWYKIRTNLQFVIRITAIVTSQGTAMFLFFVTSNNAVLWPCEILVWQLDYIHLINPLKTKRRLLYLKT